MSDRWICLLFLQGKDDGGAPAVNAAVTAALATECVQNSGESGPSLRFPYGHADAVTAAQLISLVQSTAVLAAKHMIDGLRVCGVDFNQIISSILILTVA